jgi:hypothetical protein
VGLGKLNLFLKNSITKKKTGAKVCRLNYSYTRIFMPDKKAQKKQVQVSSVLPCRYGKSILKEAKYYCVSDILTCKPALVFTIGALDEI